MADASKLKRLRRSSLGRPPPVEEARSDLAPVFKPIESSTQKNSARSGSRATGETASSASLQATLSKTTRIDGRSLRRSGRTIQFATRVSPEFDERIRQIARREGMLLVEVLEKALDAYENNG